MNKINRYNATTTAPADEIRAAFDDYTDNGAGCEKFATLTEAASRADVSGDVDEFDGDRASEYETSARAFLTMTGAAFSARFLGMFDSLTEWGETENVGAVRGDIPVWRVTISTDGGKMSVRFRGSINDGRNGRTECGVYDVLAALVKSEPGTFDNFANEYGYFPIQSQAAYRRAERVFFACCREWRGCTCPAADLSEILKLRGGKNETIPKGAESPVYRASGSTAKTDGRTTRRNSEIATGNRRGVSRYRSPFRRVAFSCAFYLRSGSGATVPGQDRGDVAQVSRATRQR